MLLHLKILINQIENFISNCTIELNTFTCRKRWSCIFNHFCIYFACSDKSRLVGPFTSMNIFNSGRIITFLWKHPSSHFRPSLLMLCGFKIPPLKICRIISPCVGCTKEFLEIHRKNAKVVATFSHMAASWLPHACMAALLCRPLKVALWATINGGKKVTMRRQPSSCSPCGCHLTTEKTA